MSGPLYRVDYETGPHIRGVHVALFNVIGQLIACGGASRREWPFANAEAAMASVMLGDPVNCDHAGPYREPRSVWTGQAARP